MHEHGTLKRRNSPETTLPLLDPTPSPPLSRLRGAAETGPRLHAHHPCGTRGGNKKSAIRPSVGSEG
jgi:hypothetical protein